jgi:hypothetical protein
MVTADDCADITRLPDTQLITGRPSLFTHCGYCSDCKASPRILTTPPDGNDYPSLLTAEKSKKSLYYKRKGVFPVAQGDPLAYLNAGKLL